MWKLFKVCFISLLVLTNTAFGNYNLDNGQDGINVTGPDGKKQGKWIYYGKDRPDAGIPATGKVEEGTFKDDRKEGIWIKYHTDGATPKLKGEYENNRPKGSFTKYWANGKIKEIGTFEKNQYTDSLVRIYENGVREYVGKYNATGKEQGKITYYHPNGKPEYVYIANNGLPSGTAYRYWPNGDVKEVITYNTDGSVGTSVQKDPINPMVEVKEPGAAPKSAPSVGKTPNVPGGTWNPNGYNKVYNNANEISQDGKFKNGALWDGKVYKYDSDGILLKVEIFKEGVYHSDGQL